MTKFANGVEFARAMDAADPLRKFPDEFLIPLFQPGQPYLYFCGNSLGLQPVGVKEAVEQELKDWADLGVEGHLRAKNPWYPYHEFLTQPMAKIVGAKSEEVVVMNSLTTNLHLLFVSFYRPIKTRYKILTHDNLFPSDQYALQTQTQFHGFADAVIQVPADKLVETIEAQGDDIALVWLEGLCYLTGEALDIEGITRLAQSKSIRVGWDLAHAAGNLNLKLHDWNVDFAVWCSYKYLNGGPGSLGGAFVHERHLGKDLPRFGGWWGHDKVHRFEMAKQFAPMPTAEAWQLSNPPILSMSALKASLEVFDRTSMAEIRAKSEKITGYLEFLLAQLGANCEIITPSLAAKRGAQLSVKLQGSDNTWVEKLSAKGIICDFRTPNVFRFAPTPLYNRYEDVWHLSQVLGELLG